MRLKPSHYIFIIAAVILGQWFHFVFYYNQPKGIALLWSVVDWSVWFLLAYFLFLFSNRKALNRTHLISSYIGFLIFSGTVHVVVTSAIYALLYDTDKTIFESALHLTNKRWINNLLIAGVISLLIEMILSKSRTHQTAGKNENRILTIKEGSELHRIQLDELMAIQSARNYIVLFLPEEDLVIRSSLKSVQDKIPSNDFIQISRSTIVNKSFVRKVDKYSKYSFQLHLNEKLHFKIGKTFLGNIEKHLANV